MHDSSKNSLILLRGKNFDSKIGSFWIHHKKKVVSVSATAFTLVSFIFEKSKIDYIFSKLFLALWPSLTLVSILSKTRRRSRKTNLSTESLWSHWVTGLQFKFGRRRTTLNLAKKSFPKKKKIRNLFKINSIIIHDQVEYPNIMTSSVSLKWGKACVSIVVYWSLLEESSFHTRIWLIWSSKIHQTLQK